MKIRLIPLVVLLTLLATACKEAPTRAGQELAQEFFAAWGDTAALKLVEAHYHAVDDSLWVPNSSMYLKKAFLETTGVNDSTRAVAQLMVYDKEQYAELQAFRILGEMKGDTLDANKARLLLQLIDWSAEWMAKPDFAEAAKQQIDREVNDMSIDKQMRIYTSVVPPATLGLELKADREAPNADMQLIEKQIKELERIYTPEQLDEFRKAYGNE